MARDFNTEIVDVVAHRPWRMPDRPWVMTQTWHDLLFAHWAMDPRRVRSKIPPDFDLDLFEGQRVDRYRALLHDQRRTTRHSVAPLGLGIS